MMRYGYVIGCSRVRITAPGARIAAFDQDKNSPRFGLAKLWVVPYVVTDEEIAEQVFAGGVRVCNR